MSHRLLAAYLSLLTVVLVALAVPLGMRTVASDIQTVSIDRDQDTARFASLAQTALRTGRLTPLIGELRRYAELFDAVAMVVGRDGKVVVSWPSVLTLSDPDIQTAIETALSGQRVTLGATAWPWSNSRLIAGEPVGQDGEVIGAVITVSRTGKLRAEIWRTWGLIGSASIVFMLVGLAAGRRLVSWILRPIHDLSGAVAALADGNLRVHIPTSAGPPEVRHLTASFNGMSDQLAALVDRQRTFVSYASHQLRGPMGILRLGVDNLEPHLAGPAREDYDLVRGEVGRLTRMCDSLLSYAHSEVAAGDAETTDLAALADGRVAAWEATGLRAGIRLCRAGADVALAHVNGEMIGMATDALIENAIKFSGPGCTVTVAVLAEPGGQATISVVDDGPGMSADDLTRAAQPFWRRADHQNVEGSGLGAAIADALITAAGGTLTFQHASPHGVDARIHLPPADLP